MKGPRQVRQPAPGVAVILGDPGGDELLAEREGEAVQLLAADNLGAFAGIGHVFSGGSTPRRRRNAEALPRARATSTTTDPFEDCDSTAGPAARHDQHQRNPPELLDIRRRLRPLGHPVGPRTRRSRSRIGGAAGIDETDGLADAGCQ